MGGVSMIVTRLSTVLYGGQMDGSMAVTVYSLSQKSGTPAMIKRRGSLLTAVFGVTILCGKLLKYLLVGCRIHGGLISMIMARGLLPAA
jgi:hypothetical protein